MATLGLPKAAHGLENRERQLAHRHHVSARVDDDVGQLAVIGWVVSCGGRNTCG